MHHVHEPRAYALDNLAIMRQLWRGVRDGDVESVHQARVATRRIRAALPVIDEVDNEDVKLFRTIGRCLGRLNRLGRAMKRMLPAAGLVALPLVMWRVGGGSTDGSRT